MNDGNVTVMKGLIDCVRCGLSPQQLFMKKSTGQHYCKRCLDKEFKKTPAVRLVGVKEEEK